VGRDRGVRGLELTALLTGSGLLVVVVAGVYGSHQLGVKDAVERWRARLPRLGP
jgi:hypothetical protein